MRLVPKVGKPQDKVLQEIRERMYGLKDYRPQAFIGIDPGSKGCLCMIVPERNIVRFVDTTELPVSIMASLKQVALSYFLAPVMIEDVHALPGSAAKSTFSFGFNVGMITTIVDCAAMPRDKVPPKEWQKTIGISAKKGRTQIQLKKEVAEKAIELYPNATLHGPKGGLIDGRSDALMIAHYCRIKYSAYLGSKVNQTEE